MPNHEVFQLFNSFLGRGSSLQPRLLSISSKLGNTSEVVVVRRIVLSSRLTLRMQVSRVAPLTREDWMLSQHEGTRRPLQSS